jgi:cubilin
MNTQQIQVEPGMQLILQFTAFNIESHSDCAFDYLTITDGNGTTLMAKTCGSNLPLNITSMTNIVNISFRSNAKGTESGWSVRWSSATPGLLKS